VADLIGGRSGLDGLRMRIPITLDIRAWYFGISLVTLLGIAGLAIYGFTAALGGQPACGGKSAQSRA
jgi:hypothetical protein